MTGRPERWIRRFFDRQIGREPWVRVDPFLALILARIFGALPVTTLTPGGMIAGMVPDGMERDGRGEPIVGDTRVTTLPRCGLLHPI